jgi:hypothetical protein
MANSLARESMSGDGAPAAAHSVGSSSITVKPVTSSTPARSRSRITLLVWMLLVRVADLNAVFRRPAHYRVSLCEVRADRPALDIPARPTRPATRR